MEIIKDDIAKFLHRHLVPLCAVFKYKKKALVYIATSFILSSKDEWFLITAGHVALEIKGYLENPEYCLEKVFLYDYGGLGATHHEPIPFKLTLDNLLIFGNETTLDYSAIFIRPYYRKLLMANNIEPLNEETWLRQPRSPDFYLMLGVPHQMVSVEWNNDTNSAINQVQIVTTLLHVQHAMQHPDGLAIRSSARWYGYVELAPPIADIKGMSGAPIFAFKHTADGGFRYWLVGVLSSWNESNKAIAACLAQGLGEYLTEGINQFEKWQDNEANTVDVKRHATDP